MHRHALTVVVLILVVIVSAVRGASVPQKESTNLSKPAITSSKLQSLRNSKQTNTGTSSQKKPDPGQLITTKFDSSGNPQEQCRCTVYYLCNADKVYQSPTGDKLLCDSGMVCCVEPFTYSTETQPLFPNREASSTSTPVRPSTDCKCVGEDQCPQLGTGIIQASYRAPGICGDSQVCCPTSDTNPQNPAVTLVNSSQPAPQCSCVTPTRCNNRPSNNTSNTPNYGNGIILYKSPLCDLSEICSACHPAEICCPTSDITTDPWNVPPPVTADGERSTQPTALNFQCGFRGEEQGIGNKIVNPEDSYFGEYPWMILILKMNENNQETVVCGASLLSSRVVLTAAHCVNNVSTDSLIVRAGEYDRQLPSASENLPHQDRRISEISIHPSFRASVAHYDLALIAVQEPFQLAQNVAPICAPFANSTFVSPNYDWNRCLATGWGKNAYSPNVNHQNTLKKIDLQIIDHEQCQEELRKTALGKTYVLHRSFVCAKGYAGDTCKGDGGGPLICALTNESNRYVQVGVTSWGIGCGIENPAAYASLEEGAEWLTSQYLIYNDFSFRSHV